MREVGELLGRFRHSASKSRLMATTRKRARAQAARRVVSARKPAARRAPKVRSRRRASRSRSPRSGGLSFALPVLDQRQRDVLGLALVRSACSWAL